MTLKVSSLLSIVAIWVADITAVVIEPDCWWSIIFAGLATFAVGAGAFRRLGMSRLIAISAIWAGTAIAMADNPDATWISIFAFLSTGAAVHSFMKKDSYLGGLGIALPWLLVGPAVASATDQEPAWICVIAFLTTAAIANSRGDRRGLAALIWWGAAGAIMLLTDDWYWLSVIAFVMTVSSFGFGGFSFPRGIEWDLFDRDDDGDDRVKVGR
jgi:hypothetical protein